MKQIIHINMDENKSTNFLFLKKTWAEIATPQNFRCRK